MRLQIRMLLQLAKQFDAQHSAGRARHSYDDLSHWVASIVRSVTRAMRRHRSPTRWGGVINAGSSTGAYLLATQRPAMASTRSKQPSRAITWPVAWGMIMTSSFGVTCASHAITAGRCRLDPEPGGFVPQTRDTTCTHHPRGGIAGRYLAVTASRNASAH